MDSVWSFSEILKTRFFVFKYWNSKLCSWLSKRINFLECKNSNNPKNFRVMFPLNQISLNCGFCLFLRPTNKISDFKNKNFSQNLLKYGKIMKILQAKFWAFLKHFSETHEQKFKIQHLKNKKFLSDHSLRSVPKKKFLHTKFLWFLFPMNNIFKFLHILNN